MFELSIDKYPYVIPLMKDLECDMVFILSVIENKQKGSVFVDNIDKPSSAFVVHYCSGNAIIMGCADNDRFNDEILRVVRKRNLIRSDKLKILIPNNNWYKVFQSRIDTQSINKHFRLKFNFNKEIFENYIYNKPYLSSEYYVLRMTNEMFTEINGTVVPKAYWENADRFLENGVGYAIMKDDIVISTAFSAYICNSMVDIGIETNKEYRGLDFGSYAAAEMIKYCLKYRYEPIWGARDDNESSVKLALKLGFEKVREFPVIELSMNE